MIQNSTQAVYFLKNDYECDFVVFQKTDKPLLVQVTETLSRKNFKREINGLGKARKRIKNSQSLLITENIGVPSDMLPERE